MYYGDNDEDDYGDGVCLVPCKAKTNTNKRYLFKNTKKIAFFLLVSTGIGLQKPGTQTIFVFVTISFAESNRTQSERQLY